MPKVHEGLKFPGVPRHGGKYYALCDWRIKAAVEACRLLLPQFHPAWLRWSHELGKQMQNKFRDVMLPLRLPPSKQMVSKELACFKEPSFVVPEHLGQSERRAHSAGYQPEAVRHCIEIALVTRVKEAKGWGPRLRARHNRFGWTKVPSRVRGCGCHPLQLPYVS